MEGGLLHLGKSVEWRLIIGNTKKLQCHYSFEVNVIHFIHLLQVWIDHIKIYKPTSELDNSLFLYMGDGNNNDKEIYGAYTCIYCR